LVVRKERGGGAAQRPVEILLIETQGRGTKERTRFGPFPLGGEKGESRKRIAGEKRVPDRGGKGKERCTNFGRAKEKKHRGQIRLAAKKRKGVTFLRWQK